MKKIGIIGIGNPLRKDDGIGIVLLERLQKKKVPKNIEYIDGGTGGMNLLHHLARFDTVLILDAVDFHGTPGEMHLFSLQDIQKKTMPFFSSTHETDFLTIINLSKELKELPKHLIIVGIQPSDVSYGKGLTTALESVLNDLLNSIQKTLQQLLKESK